MIKAIIIDDEQHCTERLQSLLKKKCDDNISIIGTYDNTADAINGITTLRPDLLFLDVMLGADTGFDLLRKLPAVDFEVIFTTAYDQYAVEAFRFSALDYLLKPVDAGELMAAVEKLHKKTALRANPARVEALLANLKNDAQSKRLAVPTMHGVDFINLSSLIRCQSEGNYTIMHLAENRKLIVARTLKVFEDLLLGYEFFRVHNSHIVNLAHVKSYTKGKVGYVVMSDNSHVEVATRRKDEFMKKMLL